MRVSDAVLKLRDYNVTNYQKAQYISDPKYRKTFIKTFESFLSDVNSIWDDLEKVLSPENTGFSHEKLSKTDKFLEDLALLINICQDDLGIVKRDKSANPLFAENLLRCAVDILRTVRGIDANTPNTLRMYSHGCRHHLQYALSPLLPFWYSEINKYSMINQYGDSFENMTGWIDQWVDMIHKFIDSVGSLNSFSKQIQDVIVETLQSFKEARILAEKSSENIRNGKITEINDAAALGKMILDHMRDAFDNYGGFVQSPMIYGAWR